MDEEIGGDLGLRRRTPAEFLAGALYDQLAADGVALAIEVVAPLDCPVDLELPVGKVVNIGVRIGASTGPRTVVPAFLEGGLELPVDVRKRDGLSFGYALSIPEEADPTVAVEQLIDSEQGAPVASTGNHESRWVASR